LPVDDERSDATDEGLEQEVVEGVVVLAEARAVEAVREGPPPFVTVAAVAATSFVAGAATAAMLGRRLGRLPARAASPSAGGPLAAPLPSAGGHSYRVVASRRYVVDVHTVAPR
jgi:hypothetical protein